MAVEIVRSLEEIDNKVRGLNKTLKDGQAESRELDKALRLDPKSAETVEKRMKSLQTAVGTATQKVALLKQKQDEANKAFAKGDISAAEFKKIELSVLKSENELKALNNEIAKTQKMRVDQTAASFDGLTAKLGKVQSAAQKVSKVATAILAALTAAATAFVIIGDELDDTSKKFRISAEELQKQRNLYSKLTDDSQNYDHALSSLNAVMTSIAKGKGAAYLDTLTKLGVSTTDAAGKTKSAAEIYGDVVTALGAVSDETERAALASVIFGENGLNVANVAALSREELAAYNEELAAHGIVSSEAAAQAGEIANRLADCKQQISAASAELMVALLPTMLTLIETVQTTLIPLLTGIAQWFAEMSPAQQQFIFFLLMLVILLPKIIAIVTSVIGVVKAIRIALLATAPAVGAVSTAGAPLFMVITAICAAIVMLIVLFAMLAGKSKDVTAELNSQTKAMGNMESQYSSMAADMGGTVGVVSTNSTSSTQTVQYNVDITATGDSAGNQAAADSIADNLADRINAQLGGKI